MKIILIKFALFIGLLFYTEIHADYEHLMTSHPYQSAKTYAKMTLHPAFHEKLESHPLYSYLLYHQIVTDNRLTEDEVSNFLSRYPNEALSESIRRTWLLNLAQEKKWSDYLRYYTQSDQLILQCHKLRAQLEINSDLDLEELTKLWLKPTSQHVACDRAFHLGLTQHAIPQPLVEKRFLLTLSHGHIALSRYLAHFVSNSDQALALLKTAEHPASLLQHQWPSTHQHLSRIAALIQGISIKNPLLGASLYYQLKPRLPFSPADKSLIHRALSLSLGKSGKVSAIDHYKLIQQQDKTPALTDLILRICLTHNDWKNLLIITQHQADSASRFWHLMSLAKVTGQDIRFHLLKLSREADYYGVLASEALNQEPEFLNERHDVKPESIHGVFQIPGIQRAMMLYNMNQLSQARKEWLHTVKQLDEEQRYLAARFSEEIRWHEMTFQSIKGTRFEKDLALRFPFAYADHIQEHCTNKQVDTALVYGLMRQESAYKADAKSPVGASGLMQLMPSTAKLYQRHVNVNLRNEQALLNPKTNIILGCAHLNDLKNHYHQIPYELAAYNAGPGAVSRWRKKFGSDIKRWVELIPYHETRDYVKRVIAYRAIYAQLLKKRSEQ